MSGARTWFLAIVVGLIVTLGGLLWDAIIHSGEHRHPAEESLLDPTNPGHVVFGLGLVLMALITLAGFTVTWLRERRGEVRWYRMSVPAVLWLGVGLAGAVTLAALARTG